MTNKRAKEFMEQLERFFEEKLEPSLKKAANEIESLLKKEVKLGKGKPGFAELTNGKAKAFLADLEKFFDEKVEPGFKKATSEMEKFFKQEIRFGNGKKEKKDLIKYDPDSPLSYIAAFLRDRSVASVAPSTKYVVDRVIKAMELDRAKVVVEFGPAEGVMTRRILPKLASDGLLVAIELNADFVETVRKIRDPRLRVVHGDVRNVDTILEDLGVSRADVIISGIPFSFFDPEGRHRLLAKISSLLNPGGRFVAYQFTTHLIPLLKRHFSRLKTQFEIRNLPPHFVFTCYK